MSTRKSLTWWGSRLFLREYGIKYGKRWRRVRGCTVGAMSAKSPRDLKTHAEAHHKELDIMKMLKIVAKREKDGTSR